MTIDQVLGLAVALPFFGAVVIGLGALYWAVCSKVARFFAQKSEQHKADRVYDWAAVWRSSWMWGSRLLLIYLALLAVGAATLFVARIDIG